MMPRPSSPRISHRIWSAIGFVGLLVSLAIPAHAQADASTAEQAIRLQVFGMASYVRPDFGGALKNGGATVGADANLKTHFLGRAQPGIEFRAEGSGGRVSNQITYSGGPRLQYPLGRFDVFGDFLVGYGKIDFNIIGIPGYTHNNSVVYSYGGGGEYNLSRAWAIRADVQQQRWKIDDHAAPFHPLAVSAGIRYQFHFRNKYGPE